jgi:hypothetical protein
MEHKQACLSLHGIGYLKGTNCQLLVVSGTPGDVLQPRVEAKLNRLMSTTNKRVEVFSVPGTGLEEDPDKTMLMDLDIVDLASAITESLKTNDPTPLTHCEMPENPEEKQLPKYYVYADSVGSLETALQVRGQSTAAGTQLPLLHATVSRIARPCTNRTAMWTCVHWHAGQDTHQQRQEAAAARRMEEEGGGAHLRLHPHDPGEEGGRH